MSSKSKTSAGKSQVSEVLTRATPRGKTPAIGTNEAILALQGSGGNRAVTELLGRRSGRPLNSGTRREMEAKFGANFSDVKVHTNEEAANTAMGESARALTAGRDIVFGKGFYAPSTSAGKRLIAHELAHVVQQRQRGQRVSGAAAESEARTAGSNIVAGKAATVQASASGVQADGMSEEEARRRQNTEKMLGPAVMASLRESGIAPPAPAPSRPPTQIELQEPGLATDLKKRGIGPQDPPVPPRPVFHAHREPDDLYPTMLRQPKKKAKDETLAEMEARLFNQDNPYASQNLVKAIESIGGKSLDPTKVSYRELLREYERLKAGPAEKPLAPRGETYETDTFPPDYKRRIIKIPGGPLGIDPHMEDEVVVYATEEDAKKMQIEEEAHFGGRAATAFFGGLAGMGAARAANRGMNGPAFGPMAEMQHGAPLEVPVTDVSSAPQTGPGSILPVPRGLSAAVPPIQDGESLQLHPLPGEAEALQKPAPQSPPKLQSIPDGKGTATVEPPEPKEPKPNVVSTKPTALPNAASPTQPTATPNATPATPAPDPAAATAPQTGRPPLAQVKLPTRGKSAPANSQRLPYPSELLEDSAERKSKAEHGADVLNLGSGPGADKSFPGVDLMSKAELSQVKAYTGPSATQRILRAMSELSAPEDAHIPSTQAWKTMQKIEALRARSGGKLEVPNGYDANRLRYIRQETVFRIADDLVGPVQEELAKQLQTREGAAKYGLPRLNETQARGYATRRIKSGGMSEAELRIGASEQQGRTKCSTTSTKCCRNS